MELAEKLFVNDEPSVLGLLRAGRGSCCGSKPTLRVLTCVKYHTYMITVRVYVHLPYSVSAMRPSI